MALVSGFVRSSVVIELCHASLRNVLEPGARVVESMTDEPAATARILARSHLKYRQALCLINSWSCAGQFLEVRPIGKGMVILIIFPLSCIGILPETFSTHTAVETSDPGSQ